jgi:hypothetical protein
VPQEILPVNSGDGAILEVELTSAKADVAVGFIATVSFDEPMITFSLHALASEAAIKIAISNLRLLFKTCFM